MTLNAQDKDLQEFIEYSNNEGYDVPQLIRIMKWYKKMMKGGRPSKVMKYLEHISTPCTACGGTGRYKDTECGQCGGLRINAEEEIKKVLYIAINDGVSESTLYRIKKAAEAKLGNLLVHN